MSPLNRYLNRTIEYAANEEIISDMSVTRRGDDQAVLDVEEEVFLLDQHAIVCGRENIRPQRGYAIYLARKLE